MKQRLFTVAAAITALLAGVVWVMQDLPDKKSAPLKTAAASRPPATDTSDNSSPSPSPAEPAPSEPKLYSYAIATTELHGLAPDAAPGMRLDLWVATQPPVTEKADVLPLLEGAILQEIVPPTLPDAPSAAILQVPLRHARKLMWADRFGSLSVLQVRAPVH